MIPDQSPTISFWICLAFACYSGLVGFAWGALGAGFLFRRYVDAYSRFDVGTVAIGVFGTLILFEWPVRVVYLLGFWHNMRIEGVWTQIWIISFATFSALGFAAMKARHLKRSPTLTHRLCSDCPFHTSPSPTKERTSP